MGTPFCFKVYFLSGIIYKQYSLQLNLAIFGGQCPPYNKEEGGGRSLKLTIQALFRDTAKKFFINPLRAKIVDDMKQLDTYAFCGVVPPNPHISIIHQYVGLSR